MFGQMRYYKPLSVSALIALVVFSQTLSRTSNAATEAQPDVIVSRTQSPDIDQPFASWSFDVGFVQNGPRSGVVIQGNAPHFGSPWIPQLGFAIQTVDFEGHMLSDTSNSSVMRGAEYFALSAKFANPYTRGLVRPYSVLKLGALLTGSVATSKAAAAGYIGLGGEFLFSELAQGLFNSRIRESTMAFYIEAGVPITGDQVQANLMQGSPYIFSGVSTTVGLKYSL